MFGHDDKDKDDINNVTTNEGQSNQDWQHPGTPIDDNKPGGDEKPNDTASSPVITPSDDKQEDADKPTPNDEPEAKGTPIEPASPSSNAADDLIDIKQDALSKLSPLIGHLDQSPEEKFRTLMMMIQASDDQGLIRQAYDTALNISDEKERAQALLDIVNEINYFTQNPAKNE
jgi:hypothetical protein